MANNNNDDGFGTKARKFFGQTKVKYFIGGMVAA